jgi:hypothetical protein
MFLTQVALEIVVSTFLWKWKKIHFCCWKKVFLVILVTKVASKSNPVGHFLIKGIQNDMNGERTAIGHRIKLHWKATQLSGFGWERPLNLIKSWVIYPYNAPHIIIRSKMVLGSTTLLKMLTKTVLGRKKNTLFFLSRVGWNFFFFFLLSEVHHINYLIEMKGER